MRRRQRSAAQWCTCGAPWIDGRCGRMRSPEPFFGTIVQPHRLAPRPAAAPLAWGPFAVGLFATMVVAVGVGLVLSMFGGSWLFWVVLPFSALALAMLSASTMMALYAPRRRS